MFDEREFQKAYKEAYDRIVPAASCVCRLREACGSIQDQRRGKNAVIRHVAAAVFCLLAVMSFPVLAERIPAVSGIVARYAPALGNYILPTKLSSTSQGITMQVEAVKAEAQTAEILISFSDAADGGDLIRGKVDLYDSYRLQSYGAESNVGGSSFLEYNEAEDKAYFKIDVSTWDKFDRTKLKFSVYQLLTDCRQEQRQLALDDLVKDPALREVISSGEGGRQQEAFEPYFGMEQDGSLRKTVQVMELQKADADMAEDLTVTGIGYGNGILRVQMCRGSFGEADRHARLFLKGPDGEERNPDLSVTWQEAAEGQTLLFDEVWFLTKESELESLQLEGIFWIRAGSVTGNWSVTFQVE